MAEGAGLETIAGFAREGLVATPTWPSAAAAQVLHRLPLLSAQPSDGVITAPNVTTRIAAGPESADVLAILPSDTWTLQLQYQGFEEIFAIALGYMAKRLSGVLQPSTVATGAYRHFLEIDTTLSTAVPWIAGDGFIGGELTPPLSRVRRGTTALWRQVSVWEMLSAMVRKLTLTATLDAVTCTVEWAPHSLSRVSTVNTSSTMIGLPLNTAPNVLFRHAVVRLGPYSTSVPLSSAHNQGSINWSLELDNQLSAAAPSRRTGLAPDEPERVAAPVITLALALPRYRSDQRFSDWAAGTVQMASIVMTGGNIPGTATPYSLTLWMPALTLASVASPISGATVPGVTIQGRLQVPAATPAGFPAPQHLSPMQWAIVSGESRHPLLAA